MGAPVHSEIIIMKAFIFATVLAVATAIPIEDTDEVKAAKAEHAAAHAEAELVLWVNLLLLLTWLTYLKLLRLRLHSKLSSTNTLLEKLPSLLPLFMKFQLSLPLL